MANVYVIRESGETETMSRIRCRDEDRELQLILEMNADLLPGEQIDPEDPRRWLLVKREMPVPDPNTGTDRWSIDFLFADQDAIPTFVECKRFADTRSRREVVGQMLEYAANGHHYWSRDTLRDFAAEAANKRGVDLDAALANLQPTNGDQTDEYFDRMQQNLREGQLRIIFFLEESPVELRSVVDFLNRQMERSEVLLVEARQYSHGGTKIVVPTLFGYTEEARMVKRSVTVSSAAARRRWDRASYLADATKKLLPEHVHSVESLLDFCISLGSDITWGTGNRNGSFSVKEPSACPRSLLTCYSNGDLSFNFHWLHGSEAATRARERFAQLLSERIALRIPDGEAGVALPAAEWVGKLDGLLAALKQITTECRAAAA